MQESSDEESSSDEEITAQTYAVNVALFKSKLKDNLFRKVSQVQDALEELAADSERAGLPKKERRMWRTRITEYDFIVGALGERAMQYAKIHFAGSSKLKHKAAEKLLKEARSCNRTFGPESHLSDTEERRPVKRRTQPPSLSSFPVHGLPCYMCGKPGHFKIDCPLSKQGPSKVPERLRVPPKCFKCGLKGHLASDCSK